MNKKQLIVGWAITGVLILVLIIVLPYNILYKLFWGFISWLILFLLSQLEEKVCKIKELKELIFYIEDKFNVFNKMKPDEGREYYELKWILKERDKTKE